MNQEERSKEEVRLHSTLEQLKAELKASGVDFSSFQGELKGTLKSYWESSSKTDEAQMIEAIDRQRSITALAHHKYEQLKRMIDSPYFGRIDFVEEAYSSIPEQFYIGIASFSDQTTGEILIYDWRTPVAGMFYDFERGPACYECPAGKVEGTITLKRQYTIHNGKIVHLFDADIQIDDEILREILSKSADDKMHTIVTSIQREQNQIIRNDACRVLFVEGPAGSGKTSIAMHRIAYLLYRDRNQISAKNILILSPNHIFSDYISNVLPEIGEENVLQMTFQDYVAQAKNEGQLDFETRAEQLEYLFSRFSVPEIELRIANISYKTSGDFEILLNKAIEYIDKQWILDYPALTFQGQLIFSKADWRRYNKSFGFLPLKRRLGKIREQIRTRMRDLVHELRNKHVQRITGTGEEVNPKTIKVLARIAAKEELTPISSEVERLTTFDPLALYQRLLADAAFRRRFDSNVKYPDKWQQLSRQTLSSLRQGKIPYEDSFAFLYFYGRLAGFAVNHDIKHLVIDEAQDYTALQYKIVRELFPLASWTVLGDPCQAVHPYLNTADFQTAGEIIASEAPMNFRLRRSYRSTKEIQAFCQALLSAKYKVECVNRSGTKPEVIYVKKRTLPQIAAETIDKLKREGCQSIALIGKTAENSRVIYNELVVKMDLSLIVSEDDRFHQGIVAIPGYLAKGLEFDAVLIIDADEKNYGRQADCNFFYTVCTRALHRLILFADGAVSPLVGKLPQDLYTVYK
ncbi:MAG: AAA family ATPase [Pelosinus sp.]|nr:AAA family ATPase [Pelosinus sp.]